MIPEIFKALRCLYNVNKNIFNSVGAKHSQRSCSMIINWLIQVAFYFYKSKDKIHIDIFHLDWNLKNLYIDAYKNNKKVNESQLIIYYHNKIGKLKAEYESYCKEQNDIQLSEELDNPICREYLSLFIIGTITSEQNIPLKPAFVKLSYGWNILYLLIRKDLSIIPHSLRLITQ